MTIASVGRFLTETLHQLRTVDPPWERKPFAATQPDQRKSCRGRKLQIGLFSSKVELNLVLVVLAEGPFYQERTFGASFSLFPELWLEVFEQIVRDCGSNDDAVEIWCKVRGVVEA